MMEEDMVPHYHFYLEFVLEALACVIRHEQINEK